MLCFKVEMNVCIPAEQTFHLLSDLRRRKEWDLHYEFVTFTLVSTSLVANCNFQSVTTNSDFSKSHHQNCQEKNLMHQLLRNI